jgi:hypothetical protein
VSLRDVLFDMSPPLRVFMPTLLCANLQLTAASLLPKLFFGQEHNKLGLGRDEFQVVGHDQRNHSVRRQLQASQSQARYGTYACGAILT